MSAIFSDDIAHLHMNVSLEDVNDVVATTSVWVSWHFGNSVMQILTKLHDKAFFYKFNIRVKLDPN